MRMNKMSEVNIESTLKTDRLFFNLKKNMRNSANKFCELWALAKNDNPSKFLDLYLYRCQCNGTRM